MDNELIYLPEPSVTRNRPKVIATAPSQPAPSASTPSVVDKVEPASVPLPPPGDDELVNDNKESTRADSPHSERPTRTRKPSPYVQRILTGEIDGGTARGKSRFPKGLQAPTGSAAIAESAMAIQIEDGTSDDDPKTLAQAMARPDWPEWQKAMEEELGLMAKYNVWDVVDEPEDVNIVGSRWVFCIKRDSSGKILKYRARLVAQGFTQMYGVDFQDTFAPVARLSSIRVVIALAASEDWELHQMDVKSAYLNSPIDTAVYMRLPPGHGQKGKVACVK